MLMNKGFTLVETLFALLALSICTLLLIPVLQIMNHMSHQMLDNQEMMRLMQIRYMLAQSSEVEVSPSAISFRYHQEDWSLSFHHQNIVKEPGYEIFMMHMEQVLFTQKNDCVYVQFQKEGGREYEALLYCES